MTRTELERYRQMRQAHLMYGIGAVDDPVEYAELERRVVVFAESLDHPADRAVVALVYLRGMSAVAAGHVMECSDRTVYRVWAKVLGRLPE